MKLPEITYGSVPQIRSTDPRTAAVEFQQKQNILGQAMQAAQDISERYREFQVTKAGNAYADEMAQFRTEAANISQLSPGEVAALDIDVDTDGRDYIPKIEWYPQLLEKRMSEYREKHAATIRSPVDRNKWLESVERVDNKVLEQEVQRAAQESLEFEIVERQILADKAINEGNYDLAESYYTGPEWSSSPQRKATQAAARAKIFLGRKTDEVNQLMLNANTVEEYNDVVTLVTNPEWNEGLSPGTVLRMSNSIITQRNGAITAQKLAKTDSQNALAIDALVGVTEGVYTINDINAMAHDLGKENHARLITALKTQSAGGTVTSQATKRDIQVGIMDLRAGFYDGDFGDRVRELQEQLGDATSSVDMETGQIVQLLSLQDASSLSKELAQIKEFPYQSGEYKALLSEINDRILGAPEEGFGFMATDESRQIRANAVNHLRNWVEQNGGSAADLELWRQKYMPGFLEPAARASFIGLPQEIKDSVVYGGTNMVDHAATERAFMDRVKETKTEINSLESKNSNVDHLQRKMQNIKRGYDQYIKWYKSTGEYQYGN